MTDKPVGPRAWTGSGIAPRWAAKPADTFLFVDLSGAVVEADRSSIFDRSRHAIAHFTLVMVLLSTALALVGVRIGTRMADEHGARLEMAAQPSGQGVAEPAPAAPTSAPDSRAAATTVTSDRDSVVDDDRATPGSEPESESVSPAASTTSTSAPAPSAPGSSAVDSEQSPTPQDRGHQALGAIGYSWRDRLPGWQIDFLDGRSGLFGLTLVDDKRIEIYVRDDQSDELLVHIVAHELGHAVDVTLNDGPDRRRWQASRGIGDEPWWPDAAASDFSTGAGDFAESFAYWQVPSNNFRSELGSAPDAIQLQLMAELAGG